MGYQEYLAAREFVTTIGQPIITYTLIVSAVLFLLSVYCLVKRDEQVIEYSTTLLKVNTTLLALGFLVFAWFHFKIYSTIEVVYPDYVAAYVFQTSGIQLTSSRFAIPLWIEAEKMYFWALCLSFFAWQIAWKYRDVATTVLPVVNIMLSFLIGISYFYANPFADPLPVVHSEITGWTQAITSQDPQFIGQMSMQVFGRVTYYYNSMYMWTHPPMLFIAYASLAVTFAACLFMLLRKEVIYDRIAYSHAKIGYLFLTLGMLIGYPWAVIAWEGDWWWDPKINGSIMMWVLYSAYLHTRIYLNRKYMWEATAILGIVCFASLVFTYLLTYVVPGIHSVAQT
ncbi:MAG: cytochrome c biogenesis protein CcsA [Methanosarcinaceae archaeon]|nr:cytochrome c biogenesis protein CcsA [Methanosarcinaceae archaeon]